MKFSLKKGVLEQVIDEIKEHDEKYPDHGVGCACQDKHAAVISKLMLDKGLNDREYSKSLRNLQTIFFYLMK